MKKLSIVMLCGLLTLIHQYTIKTMDEEAILIENQRRAQDKATTEKKSEESRQARQHAAEESIRHSTSQDESPIQESDSIPHADPLNHLNLPQHSYSIDLNSTIEAMPEEPIQATAINVFDPKNIQDLSPESKIPEGKQTFKQYNDRRLGQADPFKSFDAITKMDKAMETLSNDLFNMDGADILKFEQFQDQLNIFKKQWITDPTQIKSDELSQFLNDFQSFAKKEINSYSPSSLARSSWQKMIDAIQDFIDIITGYEKQAIVVAQPVYEEQISNRTKMLPVQ